MKRFAFAVAGLLALASLAWAQQTTRTAPVAPERGEHSEFQASIVNVARLKPGFGTGTASSNAVTINKAAGIITTESLTTAAASTVDITLTNSKIAAGDAVLAIVDPNGSTGQPSVKNVAVSASTAVIKIKNNCTLSGAGDCSSAFNGALKIYFWVLTAGNPY